MMQAGESGGGPGDALGGVADSASQGLSTAKEKAGDVLEGIFGGVPWEMSPDSIVDAVTGTLAPHALELIGVMSV